MRASYWIRYTPRAIKILGRDYRLSQHTWSRDQRLDRGQSTLLGVGEHETIEDGGSGMDGLQQRRRFCLLLSQALNAFHLSRDMGIIRLMCRWRLHALEMVIDTIQPEMNTGCAGLDSAERVPLSSDVL